MLTALPVFFNLDYIADIQPIFDSYGCSGCHDGNNGDFNLNAGAGNPLLALLGTTSNQSGLNLIEPGFPELSYIMQKVNCHMPSFGVRMPFAGGILSIEEQGIMHDWIFEGARGEFPPNAWFRDILFRDGAESVRL